jgi:hypothetical protein
MSLFEFIIIHCPTWLIPLLIAIRSWVYPPSPHFDSEFIGANSWAEGYLPQGDPAAYGRVSKFAEAQYAFMIDLSEGLDKKADEQVRFMITIVGAVTAAAAAKLFKVEGIRPIPASVALACICLAIYAAIRARTPQSNATPMSPRDLLKVTDLASKPTLEQIESVIAASHHVAILGMRSLTTWKARLLNRSALAFAIGFALLLYSLIRF